MKTYIIYTNTQASYPHPFKLNLPFDGAYLDIGEHLLFLKTSASPLQIAQYLDKVASEETNPQYFIAPISLEENSFFLRDTSSGENILLKRNQQETYLELQNDDSL